LVLFLTMTAMVGGLANPQVLAGPAHDATDWWSFRPLTRPPLPRVTAADWVRTPLDAFILAGLEARGLRPAPPADRITLIRRVTYDLHGLPPTPAEADAFVNDS